MTSITCVAEDLPVACLCMSAPLSPVTVTEHGLATVYRYQHLDSRMRVAAVSATTAYTRNACLPNPNISSSTVPAHLETAPG